MAAILKIYQINIYPIGFLDLKNETEQCKQYKWNAILQSVWLCLLGGTIDVTIYERQCNSIVSLENQIISVVHGQHADIQSFIHSSVLDQTHRTTFLLIYSALAVLALYYNISPSPQSRITQVSTKVRIIRHISNCYSDLYRRYSFI